MNSTQGYLLDIQEKFEHLKVEQTRIFEMFEELASFQIRLAEFSGLSNHEDLYMKLLDVLSSTVEFSFAQILRRSEGTDGFELVHEKGVPGAMRELLTLDENLLQWAVANEQVSIYPVEDEGVLTCAQSMIVIPLVGRREVVGATVLWTPFPSEELNQHVFQMLSIFSKEVSGSMENLDLYLRTQSLTYLLDNTIESVPHAIIVFGLNDRIIACNKNAEFLFGFKRFFALEERYQDVLPKDVSHTFSALILSTLEGRCEIDQEMDYAIDARTRLTLGISSSLLSDKHGTPQGVLFICRDMSLSREVEKLRDLDSMKTEFIHTVSHELKTPLTAIMSGTDILLNDKENLSPDHKEIVGIIDDASHRLQALLTDILDMSRLEDGSIEVEREWRSVEDLVTSEANMLVNASPTHTLKLEVDEDLPKVFVDAPKIRQLLENIIGNAVKYSPKGGTITVAVQPDDDHLAVSVTDQGVGIPEADIDLIWDKFYRTELATNQQIEGTGLGLSIVKHIVDLHDGEVRIASQENAGSTFTIRLPVKRSSQEET